MLNNGILVILLTNILGGRKEGRKELLFIMYSIPVLQSKQMFAKKEVLYGRNNSACYSEACLPSVYCLTFTALHHFFSESKVLPICGFSSVFSNTSVCHVLSIAKHLHPAESKCLFRIFGLLRVARHKNRSMGFQIETLCFNETVPAYL